MHNGSEDGAGRGAGGSSSGAESVSSASDNVVSIARGRKLKSAGHRAGSGSDAGSTGSDAAESSAVSHTVRRHAKEAALIAAWSERVPDFVLALLEVEQERCSAIAASAFRETGDPQRVVELLFRPAAIAMGEGWRSDESDFLEVTIAMGRMQRLFRQMTRENPPRALADPARRLLLAPAPGDQHAFGLSVVEDAFLRAGWDVDRCECDEVAEMFRLVGANSYLVVGISISVARLLPEISSLVRTLRARSRNPSVALMAGGGIVADRAKDALDAGFDMTAADAAGAVALAQARAVSGFSRDIPSLAAE